ncbi:MAG: M28 family peptidase [Planctomycetota bacterium]
MTSRSFDPVRASALLTVAMGAFSGLGLAASAVAQAEQEPAAAEQAVPKSLPLAPDREKGSQAVAEADVRKWLGTLAGADFAGRGTGQEGYGKAAQYVADHFAALGLEARGKDGSYFQNVPWTRTSVRAASMRLLTDTGEVAHEIPADRLSGRATDDAKAAGEAVLIIVTMPERTGRRMPKIEGLDEVDVEGKVAIVHVRGGGTGRSAAFARFAVMRELQGKRAKAMVFASAEPVEGGLSGSSGMARAGRNPAASAARRRPLDISIGGDDFGKLLGFAKLSADKLDEAPLATNLTYRAEIAIETASDEAPAMNVWAVLPGSDPKLRDEYVVIGSHLDHLGRRGDTIYPGADDDGSGTTGVLAVAQMFAKNPVKPQRSVLFVCFSGEERGLVGSSYFVNNSPIPLSAIAAELQMDMIGRNEEEGRDGGRLVNKGETGAQNRNSVHLVGTEKLSRTLHNLCMETNKTAKLDVEFDQESLFLRSDHANFARKGVPIAFFFTGLHQDYHQPSDTPDKINYPKLLRIARWVYDIGFSVANTSERPPVDADLWRTFKKGDRRGRMPDEPAAPMRETDK